jgi:hypothetical protein
LPATSADRFFIVLTADKISQIQIFMSHKKPFPTDLTGVFLAINVKKINRLAELKSRTFFEIGIAAYEKGHLVAEGRLLSMLPASEFLRGTCRKGTLP